jgi:hypothetical protein
MSERAEDVMVRILIEALNRLHDDLERVELLTAALSSFQHPAPEYQPGGEYLLPTRKPSSGEHKVGSTGACASRPATAPSR